MHAASRTKKDKKKTPNGWMDHYVESQEETKVDTNANATRKRKRKQSKATKKGERKPTKKAKSNSATNGSGIYTKEEFEEDKPWLLHKDYWLMDERERHEVRIIMYNIKQRQASAKALAEQKKAKEKEASRLLRATKNKAAALEKRRLSVEREKLATKNAEEDPTLALMAPAGTEKQKKKRQNKVDSILPGKKSQSYMEKQQRWRKDGCQ
jgi:hypothetical protein